MDQTIVIIILTKINLNLIIFNFSLYCENLNLNFDYINFIVIIDFNIYNILYIIGMEISINLEILL